MPKTKTSEVANPYCSQLWTSAFNKQANLNYYFPGLKQQIEAIKQAIKDAGYEDSNASALCDVAGQIVVTMEKINNEPLIPVV